MNKSVGAADRSQVRLARAGAHRVITRVAMLLFALALSAAVHAGSPFVVNTGDTDLDKSGGTLSDCNCADQNGKCSLRAAITTANNCSSGPLAITFGVATVNIINGDLPTLQAPVTITGPATIDGQNGAFNEGCFTLSDSGTTYPDGATNSSISLLTIVNCSGYAISANGHGYTITNNLIGVDALGTAKPNKGGGITLSASHSYGNLVDASALDTLFQSFPAFPVSGSDVNTFAQNLATKLATLNPCTIANNVISGNIGDGIYIHSENLGAVFVAGNFIGTDATGNVAIGNSGNGITLNGNTFGNFVGPLAPLYGPNVISGNGASGVAVDGSVYLPNLIMGNIIGAPTTLQNHVGNTLSGIATTTTPDATLTNKNPSGIALIVGPGNFIADNKGAPSSNDPDQLATDGAGVYVTGSASGVKVVGNTIGMVEIPLGTPLQSKAFGNAGDGVVVTSSGNTVQNNTIAGNKRHGLIVETSSNSGTSVLGNTIGLYPAFPNDFTLGNGFDGIHIDAASATSVGGPNQGDGNTIVANGRNGVQIRNGGSSNGWGNLVQRNTIHGNAVGNPDALPNPLPAGSGIGIDLDYVYNAPDGTHPDCSSCANLGQIAPVICTGAPGEPAACSGAAAPSASGGQTTLTWTLSTHGPADFRAEFFKIDTADDNTAGTITFLGEEAFSTDASAALTGAGCSNGACTVTLPADASGAHVLMNVTDITQLTDVGSILNDWKKGLVCFLGLTQCPTNDTSEFSNVASVPLSNNANLSSLTISAGTLTPAFDSNTISYSDSVPNATTSVTVTPTVADANATIKVNNVTVASGAASGAISLAVGNGNTITVVVTAQDGTTQKTYTITVTRAGSSNADLSGLAISAGTLTPAFASGTLAYTDPVSNATTSVTVTPTTSDANATVAVNGTPVASGAASGSIALAVGDNAITVVVTAQDGTTQKTYTITVTRAPSSNADLSNLTISAGILTPAFASNTLAYTDSVTNATASVTVTPTSADAGATIKVNNVTVASGAASGAIALVVGNGNVISVAVTAADSVTTKTYTITVDRAGAASNNASLSNLAISAGTLTPGFSSSTLAYTDSVTNATASVTVTPTAADAGATIKVNNVTVASGAASGPIALAVGNGNVISVVVTAADATTTQTYTITVNRAGAASNNAALSNLTISAGTLTPAFASTTLAYTDAVANATASVTVTPTAADAGATIKVNNVTVASGAVSGAIALAVGNGNVISVVVTAADATTTQTYTITVNRAGAASNNAALSNLTISAGTLTPAFASNTLVYTDAVTNATASVTVTPTAADAGATIKVNNVTVASGAASGPIALAVGSGNVISVVVTAADLTTTQTYAITVNRAGALSNDATLGNLTISAGTLTPAFAANTLNYSDAVGNATASVTVTPTTAAGTATVTVNGSAVASGSASGAIALAVGPNPIHVVVTAQDGTTTLDYLIVVTRAAAAVQTQVSGMSFTGTGTITATIAGGGAGCGFGSYAFVGPPAPAPAGVAFPDGLFQFTATGCSGTVTITATFPTAFQAGEQYWKYGPTPGPVVAHWYALGAPNNIVLAGNTATFTIADGGLGDDDLAPNSQIVDAGGPGVATSAGNGNSVTPAPSLSAFGLMLLGMLLALAGWRAYALKVRGQR